MTSARQFIRVTNEWQEILIPRADPSYLASVSGYGVNIFLSNTQIKKPNRAITDKAHYFTVGGTIGQMKVESTEYAYARVNLNTEGGDESPSESASDEDPDDIIVTLVVDNSAIPQTDVEDIQEEVDNMGVELMKLIGRVTKYKVQAIDHDVDYELLARQFVDTTASNHIFMAELHHHILSVRNSMFLAEDLLASLRIQVNRIDRTVQDLIHGDTSGDISTLQRAVQYISSQVVGILSDIDSLEIGLAATNDKVEAIEQSDIGITKEKVANLSKSFAQLNNSIVRLCAYHTPEEIASAFNRFIADVPSDIVNVLTSIRDKLVEMAENFANAVYKSDTLLIDGNSNKDAFMK